MPPSEENSVLDYFNPKQTRRRVRLPSDNLFLGIVVLVLGLAPLVVMLLVLLEEGAALNGIGYLTMLMSISIPAGVMIKLGIGLIRRRKPPSAGVDDPVHLQRAK
jgi:hypothetical protein